MTKLKSVVGIIPARMGSSRFGGKPMMKIHGMPMIGHVYFRACMSETLTDVYVATCDEVIFDYIQSVGGKAVMTKDTHERASDRAEEAMIKVEEKTGKRTDVLVMIQGDEPMLHPEMIDEAMEPLLEDESVLVSNLMYPILEEADLESPNVVKAVTDLQGYALYFSREPIPSRKKFKGPLPAMKQIAIIPFRRDFLIRFGRLPQTPLEIIESVDMLRVLEHGHRVRMVQTKHDTYSVDVPEDLTRVEEMMKNDRLMKQYLKS